jgi:hypothetical protein
MPKRLSDITHNFERSAQALESTQEEMTSRLEILRTEVDIASQDHRRDADELRRYLREHPDEVVIANDYGYHYDPGVPGSIRCRPVHWAHHVWVEDPEPSEPNTYRVPVTASAVTEWAPYVPIDSPEPEEVAA